MSGQGLEVGEVPVPRDTNQVCALGHDDGCGELGKGWLSVHCEMVTPALSDYIERAGMA